MEGAAYEKNGLEETLTIYKKRREFSLNVLTDDQADTISPPQSKSLS